MKLSTRSRPQDTPPGLVGTARVARRAAAVVGRVRPGDVAFVDHLDLDRATAQALVDAGVGAVVNAAAMISGRYPALGPEVLPSAGVLVVDGVGAEGFAAVRDGASVRVHEGRVYAGDTVLATGRPVDTATVAAEMEDARAGLTHQLSTFTHNATEFLRREQDLLLHGLGVPELRARMSGRPVLVLVRAPDHEQELAGIRRYVADQRPVLIGIERGADALLQAGLRPDIVVVDAHAGHDPDRELPSAKALRQAREVVVRVDRGAARGGLEAFERLGVRPIRFESAATPEDVGLLLADSAGAALIVGVGMHATLDDFLDQQRPGLASTYLTRLRVGPRLVDALGAPALLRPGPDVALTLVTLAGLLALAVAVAGTPVGQRWFTDLGPVLTGLLDRLQGLLP
ncbi:MAG: putative cytokinetic ring protein SteA [Nocardioides sp.]